MELTVKELFHDAVLYDVPLMAHAVYYAVQKGIVQWEDSESRIPFGQLDHDEVIKMRDANWLQMCTIRLFVVPIVGKRFAVYLAETGEEAEVQHRMIYGGAARRVMDVSGRMDASIYCEETGMTQSFRELKQRVVDFPYFVGEM